MRTLKNNKFKINELKENNFIVIPRDFINFEWYTDKNVFQLYLHLLLNAESYTRKVKFDEVLVGSVITTTRELSIYLRMSTQQIRTALDKLEATGYIEREANNQRTIIYINDWETFTADNIVGEEEY